MTPTPATLAWELWRRRRRRNRNLAAWSLSLLLVLVTLGAAAWAGWLHRIEVGEKGEAIAVKLGNPEGEDLPLQVSALPDPAMQAVLAAQRETALTAVEETRTEAPEPDAVSVAPVKKTKTVPEKSQAESRPKPAASPVKTVPSPAPDAVKSDKPAVTEKVIRGVEKGNASELILKPQGDKISQNAYWPVYLFMPLPAQVDSSLLGRIRATQLYSAEDLKALVLQSYTQGTGGLTLTADPGLAMRPALWQVLEAAGYDVANADYKRGKDLRPVVITFALGVPKGTGDNPEITGVHLDQSSGSGPVDEAVLYAFRRSTFANGTGQVAQGRYTYDFTGRR